MANNYLEHLCDMTNNPISMCQGGWLAEAGSGAVSGTTTSQVPGHQDTPDSGKALSH